MKFLVMSSGVLVNAECQNIFQQLSEGKHKLRYIIYKIEDKEVVVEAAVSHDQVLFNFFTIYFHFIQKHLSFMNRFGLLACWMR